VLWQAAWGYYYFEPELDEPPAPEDPAAPPGDLLELEPDPELPPVPEAPLDPELPLAPDAPLDPAPASPPLFWQPARPPSAIVTANNAIAPLAFFI
jgi:hypothetical protein